MAKLSIRDLAAAVAPKFKLPQASVENFINQMFEVTLEGLHEDKQTKIKGLGTFKLQAVKARESINVSTGERVLIEGHEKVAFTPDTVMKELINKPFAHFETVMLEEGVEFADTPAEEDAPAVEAEPVVAEEPVVEETAPVTEETIPEEKPASEETPAPIIKEEEPALEEEEPAPEEEEPAPEEETAPAEAPAPVAEKVVAPVAAVVAALPEDAADAEDNEPTAEDNEPTAEDNECSASAASDEEPLKTSSWKCWLLALLLGLLCFGAGYLLGRHCAGTCSTGEEAASAIETDTIAAPTDSIETADVAAAAPEAFDYERVNADPRLRYGAYEIVGIDTIVTLREGQTMRSYCRATLGSEMIVYFQVLNGVDSLAAGQELKVPKVKVKKRK